MSWQDVEEVVRRRPDSDRSVIVTDRPEMHLAHDLPCAVEYVPADLDEATASARLTELRKLYERPSETTLGRPTPTPAGAGVRWVLIRAVALSSVILVPASLATLIVGFAEEWRSGLMVIVAVIFAVALAALLMAGMLIGVRLLGVARSTQHYSRLTSERTAIIRPSVQRLSDSMQEYSGPAKNRADVTSPIDRRPLDDGVRVGSRGPADEAVHRMLVIAIGSDLDAKSLLEFADGFERSRIVVATDRASLVADLAPTVSVEYLPEVSEASSGATLARLLEIAGSCGADEVVVWPDVADVVDVRASGVDGISNAQSLALSGVASVARRLDGIERRISELTEASGSPVPSDQLQRIVDSAAGLEATLTSSSMETLVEELGRSVADLAGKVAASSTQIDRQMSKRMERANREVTRYLDSVYQQVESLQRIYRRLDAPRGLPPMRGWAISTDLAAWLVDKLLDDGVREVLEAGSGSSTCLIAMALEQVGEGHVTALEHDQMYADRTRALLRFHGVEHRATVIFAPLIERPVGDESFSWYDTESLHLERPVDLLLVDGPPEATGPYSRFPALPLLAQLMADRATIVLDDGRRDDEAAIAERWRQRLDVGDVVTLPFERRPIALSFERSSGEARGPDEDSTPHQSEDT